MYSKNVVHETRRKIHNNMDLWLFYFTLMQVLTKVTVKAKKNENLTTGGSRSLPLRKSKSKRLLFLFLRSYSL